MYNHSQQCYKWGPRTFPVLSIRSVEYEVAFVTCFCHAKQLKCVFVIQVCICDDLPHIVGPFNEDQKKDPSSEMLETDLSVSVSYERTLTVSASEISTHYDSRCIITPNHEVVVPPETIWTAGATVVVDFKVRTVYQSQGTLD